MLYNINYLFFFTKVEYYFALKKITEFQTLQFSLVCECVVCVCEIYT